MDKHPLFKRVR